MPETLKLHIRLDLQLSFGEGEMAPLRVERISAKTRVYTAEGRKRISDGQRRRWAKFHEEYAAAQ